MWNPEADLGDVETWELFQGGVPYLARRVKPNTPGHGKYRGGANYEGIAMVIHSKDVDFFGARDGLVFHGCGGMHGGYPQATAYRLYAKNTNMQEIIQNQLDYPLGDPDPTNGEFEQFLKADITRKPYCSIFPVTFENYDIFHFSMSGGPGYGDPLERKIERVKKDLDDGLYTQDIVQNVYGVIAEFNKNKSEWHINIDETIESRENMRKERKERSMSFEKFYEYEKDKIINGKLSTPVSRMYSESLQLSDGWAKEFRRFWNLPDDFVMEVK
jgi:N-methylhydantoinase B/acetone carboxylase alpha subunit